MKKYIHKINTYLIEKYPTIWNTRIVWMLAISLIIHISFFVFGYVSLFNVATLHNRNAIGIFFENGTVFFGIILSVLLIVIWLINLFKNNSFKSFYPTSRSNLFFHFVCYLIIIFSSTTFYYSYISGLKTYISISYQDEDITNEITALNNTAMFFSHGINDYKLSNLYYPEPFGSLYCETMEVLINFNKPYKSFLEDNYQYFNLTTKEKFNSERFHDSIFAGYVYYEETEKSKIYYYKDTVVDVSKYIRTLKPSYYNYSETFFTEYLSRSKNYFYDDIYITSSYRYYNSEIPINRNKLNYQLLERNNPKEIKALLNNLLSIADFYEVKHNLTTDTWFELIYHPNNFELNSIIRKELKKKDVNITDYYDETTEIEKSKYYNKLLTDYYIESDKLSNVYENIIEIKKFDMFSDSIHFFLWITFFISSLIFAFRITGLKTILFSIITTGVLLVFAILISVLSIFLTEGTNIPNEYFISYFSLLISLIILVIPLFYYSKIRKIIVGVFINISIVGFVPFVLLIIGIISMHQANICDNKYDYETCFTLMTYLGASLSYILFIVGLIFIYFYTTIIKRWKALEER